MENEKDRLEAFFRKAFAEQRDVPSADGWNVPSSRVWEQVAAQLPATNAKKDARWSWMLLLVLLLFAFVATGFYLYWRNNQLHRTIAQQRNQIEQLQEEITAFCAYENVHLVDTVRRPEYVDNEQFTLYSATPINQGMPIFSQIANPLTPNINLKQSQSTVEVEGAWLPSASAPLGVAALPALPWRTIAPLHSDSPMPPAKPFKPIAPRTKPQFFAGVFVAPSYAYRSLEPAPDAQYGLPLFRKYEQARWSSEVGFRIGTQFAERWTLRSGIGLYNIRQESNQRFRVFYDPGLEEPANNNEVQSRHALHVPSAYGNAEVEVNLNRSVNQPLIPGEPILLDVHTQQELRFISIPLLLGRTFGNGRMQAQVTGGIAANFLNTKSFQSSVRARRGEVAVPQIQVRRDLEAVQTQTFDYLLAASVDYQLSRNLFLRLEPTFRKNLRPITYTATFQTSAYTLGLQTGLFVKW